MLIRICTWSVVVPFYPCHYKRISKLQKCLFFDTIRLLNTHKNPCILKWVRNSWNKTNNTLQTSTYSSMRERESEWARERKREHSRRWIQFMNEKKRKSQFCFSLCFICRHFFFLSLFFFLFLFFIKKKKKRLVWKKHFWKKENHYKPSPRHPFWSGHWQPLIRSS